MKTAVVGGGASGMFAAYFAAKRGDDVTLFEKNEKLGKKMFITGKGRCNVTNACQVDEFLGNVVSNPKFLTGALYGFSPSDVQAFFESERLPLKIERGNRVFPVSDKSSDVIKCLERALNRENVKIKLDTKVVEVLENNNKVVGLVVNGEKESFDKVVIATGGMSYSATGSDGDGYRFAKRLGHTVTPLVGGLCGLNLKGNRFSSLQGLTLKNVRLTATENGKTLFSEQGEMLFTHFGISGPLVLTLSSIINRKQLNNLELSLDLKPALSVEELDKRILKDFSLFINKDFRNSLDNLLPKSLIEVIIDISGIDKYKKTNLITKEERQKLAKTLKNFQMQVSSLQEIDGAIITCGGVNVKEINSKTMESKIVSGLYFCGEVIDVDAVTGGFNLQIAFSTGCAAGKG